MNLSLNLKRIRAVECATGAVAEMGFELNRFAVGKNELPLDPDDLGLSS